MSVALVLEALALAAALGQAVSVALVLEALALAAALVP